MGQFKPMVKMETTEPSVELKLKSGGEVKKQMGGAMGSPMRRPMPGMPARGGALTAAAPMKPSMAARRRAMMEMPSAAAPAGPVGRAGRMMKEGGDTLAEHASKPASKAHKGLKTGGVANAQGGYKKGGTAHTGMMMGGVANAQGGYKMGGKVTTKVDTAHPDHSPAKTGDVKMGNGGGYKTGGVAKANAGGYKEGGAPKKAYATGGRVESGAPVAMPQGRKPAPKPVSINRLSGTYKDGGRVKKGPYDKIREMDVPESVKADMQQAENERAYKAFEAEQARGESSLGDMLSSIPRALRGLFSREKSPGAVTEVEKSVTVEPGKKRGGAC
jgi:hypothetical protein